ncbi:ABC transporter permease [Erysipelotrichaceae bacterium 51-3]|uniref:ABC transporter permease n=1 Tax=Allobaculum sp. JKK-2023 TaxID=3108943 RepID=UPI002B0627F6|nr:ABC transporter permease [Allobaculum sp. JKK-2023]
MLNTLTLIIGITMMYATPMAFAALGGVISELSGVTNIGMEGMMTIGAFVGASVGYFSGNPWLGVICAGISGACLALFHAIASIEFHADQTVSGVALNLIGPALALFFCRLAFDGSAVTQPVQNKLPKLFGSNASGILGNLNVDMMVVIALILVAIAWFVIYHTKWGLRIRAVGENPAAADTLGVNVKVVRYICVILSGFLAGMGGAAVTLSIVAQFSQTSIAGQGYMALAAVIFGRWLPHGAYLACLLFGFAQALTVVFGGGTGGLPTQIIAMLPYVMTILILMLFVGKSNAPKADGVPYIKGRR